MRSLRLFYRHGCHLCEDMLEQLQSMRRHQEFEMELIDVDRDPLIASRYHARVPVLEDPDGRCLSEYFLDQVALLSYLDGG